jgi:protein-S-isoprenylcysteine O-methyltransferase Ste14
MFWWRINAWSEISAMIVSGIVSLLFSSKIIGGYLFGDQAMMPSWAKFPMVVLITTIIWIMVTILTKPETKAVLQRFYKRTQPGGPGWSKVITEAQQENIDIINTKGAWSVPSGIIAMLIGCLFIYSILFATGYWIYGEHTFAIIFTIIVFISGYMLYKMWHKIKANVL